MQSIFSPAGMQALRDTLSRRPLLAFDYDGTLAPIVQRPDAATTPPAVARRLARLVALRPVAIVTGRARADVRSRLGFEPSAIVGNHGAEWAEDGAPGTRALAAARLDPLRAQLAVHGAALAALGVRVEDKQLSLALHYRGSRQPAQACEFIRLLLARTMDDIEIFDGKCVLNVVPRGAPDKGEALLRLTRTAGVDTAVFVGDDVNDERVFRIAPPAWLTVRVGGAVNWSRATWFIDSQRQMPVLLQAMIDLLEAG